MKQLYCERCRDTRLSGKYCPVCGGLLGYRVTQGVKFKPIDTSRNAEQLKRDIRNWLERIGVVDVTFKSENNAAQIDYTLDGKTFSFKSLLQNSVTNNLAAVEQFVHYRVLGIERGIETTEAAFAGYEALPDYSNGPRYFEECIDEEDVKARYKDLAMKLHPDHGGSAEDFAELTTQYKEALR